ncbi:MAG: TA system VapC family ribonuclease toxin [Pseudomonadota bacterium]
MRYLLDVNVLIALIDPSHVSHLRTHTWFAATGHVAWASCPLTQNAVVRILGRSSYPNSPGTPAAVLPYLQGLCNLPGHQFWPDELSLFDTKHFHARHLLSPEQVTDTYLLALARANQGKLATLDKKIVTNAVHEGPAALHLIK